MSNYIIYKQGGKNPRRFLKNKNILTMQNENKEKSKLKFPNEITQIKIDAEKIIKIK